MWTCETWTRPQASQTVEYGIGATVLRPIGIGSQISGVRVYSPSLAEARCVSSVQSPGRLLTRIGNRAMELSLMRRQMTEPWYAEVRDELGAEIVRLQMQEELLAQTLNNHPELEDDCRVVASHVQERYVDTTEARLASPDLVNPQDRQDLMDFRVVASGLVMGLLREASSY